MELKFKKVKENKAKKAFWYRIQGNTWLNYQEEYDSFYLSLPVNIVREINRDIVDIIDNKLQLNEKPFEKDGKVYENISFGVKAYDDLKDELSERPRCILADFVIKFNEFTYKNKTGLSKTIVEAAISEERKSWLMDDCDGYFSSSEEIYKDSSYIDTVADDDLPF